MLKNQCLSYTWTCVFTDGYASNLLKKEVVEATPHTPMAPQRCTHFQQEKNKWQLAIMFSETMYIMGNQTHNDGNCFNLLTLAFSKVNICMLRLLEDYLLSLIYTFIRCTMVTVMPEIWV
jgi:hypothetical protein